MPAAAERHVLDTSALLCLIEDEEGAGDVERLLKSGQNIFVCFISLMEFYYVTLQEAGEEAAIQRYALLKELPIRIIESNEELGLAAGRIKASHRLSVADAWVAATAERLNAILVHKDPEFDALKGALQLQNLPYKSGKTGRPK